MTAAVSSLVYTLVQFQRIGDGLYAINACYLPISDETTKLDLIVFQLQREQDRLDLQASDPILEFLNAEFYIRDLREGLDRTATIIAISQRSNIEHNTASLSILLEGTSAAQNQLQRYEDSWIRWKQSPDSATERDDLEEQKTQLVLSVRQLASIVNSQMIKVSQQTEASRDQAFQLSGILALFSSLFSLLLLVFALRVLQPIEQLTTQVQRLTAGDRVQPLSGGVSSEISVLINEFNTMVDALEERDHRLSERAKALNLLSGRLQQAIDSIRIGLFVVEDERIALLNPLAQQMWNIELGSSPPAWMHHHIDAEMTIANRTYQVDISSFGSRGRIVLTEDITQRLSDREQLHRAQRLALIGRMLAQVTHEIRNPLNAMSLNVEMLTEETLSNDGKEMLDIISIEIQRLERTTERYLDLSRRQEANIRHQSPMNLIRELIQQEGTHLSIAFHLQGESDETAIDEDIFRRSLRNLFRNSIEANADEISITVDMQPHCILVSIADNGDGMTPEQRDSAFDPFFTTKSNGTGLGLAICRQEMESFGGSIQIVQTKVGCCFQLTLPR